MSKQAIRCARCDGPMQDGLVNMQQQPFPIEWCEIVAGLNDGHGKAVLGWGAAARESRAKRKQLETSRKAISAKRCVQCGKLEVYAI
ncbi:hypothetical protein [Bradyrhizobium guangzhouense]|uniref:hypothetical protein n=1 Tax=Bradyrhizobium guangzhouense TaxID=1325095 RepID=UPI001009882B|nr:hypothetical protein [Bradyrhizobium guangzhouense]